MTAQEPTRPSTPPLVPHLVIVGAADAAAFYERAFGARTDVLMKMPDGKVMHGGMTLPNGGVFFIMDPPDGRPRGESNVVLHIECPDVDASWKRALDAGAKVVLELADQFWGARYGMLSDPFGHKWSLATQKRDVSPEDLQRGVHSAR